MPPPVRPPSGLRLLAIAAMAASCALGGLTACGGGGDDPAPASAGATQVRLTGTAATGAAIGGATVTVTNARGAAFKVLTGADGSFAVDVDEAAPYLLSVADAAGQVWYSYAAQAGVANLTPLTTLALLQANGGRPLADLAGRWAGAPLSADAVLAAAAKVNANLQALMSAQGLDATRLNVFTSPFAADHRGLDAVLDAMRVSLSCSSTACTQSIQRPGGGVLLTWDGNIATTGITLSWTATTSGGGSTGGAVTVGLGSCKAPRPGTYSMVVQTTVSGMAGISVPEVCVDGLPAAPASQAEFCGASEINAQLPPGVAIKSCSYAGNVGTIVAQISAPFALEYTVTYTFVRN